MEPAGWSETSVTSSSSPVQHGVFQGAYSAPQRVPLFTLSPGAVRMGCLCVRCVARRGEDVLDRRRGGRCSAQVSFPYQTSRQVTQERSRLADEAAAMPQNWISQKSGRRMRRVDERVRFGVRRRSVRR
ncbi:hypothetical protein MRX96_056618 [Rhipicephalus microplus]